MEIYKWKTKLAKISAFIYLDLLCTKLFFTLFTQLWFYYGSAVYQIIFLHSLHSYGFITDSWKQILFFKFGHLQ